MMTVIATDYNFCSAHYLPHVPDTHKCKRMHGHNYRLTVKVEGEIRADGMVADFFDLDEIVAPLVRQIDHRTLNDIPGLGNPTAELIAAWFVEQIALKFSSKRRIGCRIYETPECWAEVWEQI